MHTVPVTIRKRGMGKREEEPIIIDDEDENSPPPTKVGLVILNNYSKFLFQPLL